MGQELKPCPFCGKTETLGFATRRELEDCPIFYNCEAEKCERGACDYYDNWDCVVCSVHDGGCGASGGYASCPTKAAEKWNKRVERICYEDKRSGQTKCSLCGYPLGVNYCTNCGAKVEKG